jgi:hypothetical protein
VDISTRDNPWGQVYKIVKNQLNVEKINELISAEGHIIHDNKNINQTLLDFFSLQITQFIVGSELKRRFQILNP